jgi:ATP-binding cassette subfamily F protein 3
MARQERYAKRKPLADELARVEQALAALLEEKSALEQWLSLEEAYRDEHRETLKERLARQGDLTWQLARLESEWLAVSEALESIAD